MVDDPQARGADLAGGDNQVLIGKRYTHEASGLELTDIAAIFPSANGCPAMDDFEAQLLDDVFDSQLSAVEIIPIKAVTGECFGASGPLQCIAAVEYLAGAVPARSPDNKPGALISVLGYDGTFGATVFSRRPV
jgi:hypothetical protein